MTPITRRLLVLLALAVLPAVVRGQQATTMRVDVLVYGGSSAGVMAAYTARMAGRSVLLVEPGRHLGGLASGGLGYTDIGNKYAVTGLGLDFYSRLGRYYGQLETWMFEPHVAEQVFERYVDRAGVEILYSRRVSSVRKAGAEIRSVRLEYAGPTRGAGAPIEVQAREFIDASYEGDLMARAGVSDTVGREANAQGGLAQWNRLGVFELRPDRESWVEIRPVSGDGEAIVDAVLLVPAERD